MGVSVKVFTEFADSCTAKEEVTWIAAALLATIQSLVMASAFACLNASEMPWLSAIMVFPHLGTTTVVFKEDASPKKADAVQMV